MKRGIRSVAVFAARIVPNARSLRLLPAAIILTVATSLAPVSAQAALIYDLTVSTGWTGSGSITLDTLSGSGTSGVLAFSFHTSTGQGSPQDYDLADLAAVTWSIDSSFDLSVLLSTALVPLGTDMSAILLTNQSGGHVDPCFGAVGEGSISCVTDDAGIGGADFVGVLSARLVSTSVPEPSTIALFGAGLAGLGWMSRRRKAG